MHYARTENNTVAQILRVDPATIFDASFAALFQPCLEAVEVGWLVDGNEFVAPPTPPVQIPQQVTMRQARLALLGAGLLSGVNAAIAGLPEPDKSAAQIEWEYAAVVERSSGLVPAMGAALGMTTQQLDDLFTLAATL